MTHRTPHIALCFVFVTTLLGCGAEPKVKYRKRPDLSDVHGVEIAMDRAMRYLLAQQGNDGAWKSDSYAAFKDDMALTPLVVYSLQAATISDLPRDAVQKGLNRIKARVRDDGNIDEGMHGLSYPLYTSAYCVLALTQIPARENWKVRSAWLQYLRQRQLTEELGWKEDDKQYGGWGFCAVIPRKSAPGELGKPLTESNLAATVLAVEALRASGSGLEDPAFKKALVFIERCQNFKSGDTAFDDGGFYFIYDDPVRNKAGVAGKDKNGRERFHSYGCITADGLRGLLACGVDLDQPRPLAARAWLEKHFDPRRHPGTYQKEREPNREAVYYCYARSVARALRISGVQRVSESKQNWALSLSEELMNRQHPDGSWKNTVVDQREDEPIVATAFALEALAVCRQALLAQKNLGVGPLVSTDD